MANIQNYLDDIKKALFGREVRGSIHDAIEAINKETERTTASQEHLDSTFKQLIINAGQSNSEVVDARVEANGTPHATLGDRLDSIDSKFGITNKEVVDARTDKNGTAHKDLKTRLDNVDSQLATIASERVMNFEELKSKINSSVKNNFLEICGVIEVSEDIEVPNDLTLKFNNHGKIIIKSGKTLKINCNIDAGYYKIFDFEDDTANLSVDESFQNNKQNTINRYEIKLAWFGAEGKASYNFKTGTIDGVDESKPIKRAMKFATLCSANYPNYGALSYVKILGSPNSNYYVTDDNILGCQSDSVTGVKFNFEGNGCTFYYNPSNENNSFIGNGKKINRPTYKNFGVYPFGFVGRKGYFFNTNGGDTFNSGVQGYFENVVIGDSYLLTKNCGFNILFNIEGNNMIDNFTIERCRLSFANKILYNTNSEAVNWKFVRCGISTCTENGVAIHYENTSYGGVKLEDCEMMLYSNNETLLKYNNPTVHETYANFKISGRIECRQSNFTLIDVNSGVVDVEGLNITYGASWTPNENTICAKVFKSGQVNFKNCILPLINIVEVTESKYLTRKKAIIFDDCAFFNNSKVLQSYPQIKIKSPNGIFDYYSIFSTKFCHNDIVVKNVKYNNNGAGGYDITYSCKDRKRFNVRLADKYDNGKIILPYDSYTLFPDFVNLTELKLYYEKTSNIDEIRLLFFNEGGGNSYTEYINLNFFNSGDDLLENKVICLQKGVTLKFKFFKNSIEVTDTTLYPFSFVDIEYTNMLGYKDYNTGVLGAYPIHVL